MKLFVGITDNDWFRFLRARPELDEVNFWQPGGNREFRTLSTGEPFLFKLHSPQNFIVGGGYFETSSLLPCSLAWEVFDEKNGVASLGEMRTRIEKYRRASAEPREDYQVGCVVLREPFFFDESSWIPIPKSFSLNIVQGKSYEVDAGEGRDLWDAVRSRLGPVSPSTEAEPAPMYGEPTLVRPRLGQGGFRILVTDTYERRCAVTKEKALPVLEAAHIQSVSQGGQHRIDNGLLLRSDIHRLFDRGYVTVTPDHRFLVSRKLKEDFDNGEPYYPFHGAELWLPKESDARPSREFLQWHADTVFKG
jgi:putative restriction endonuclease